MAAPNWAIFRRLDLTEDDQRKREEAEQACQKELEEFLSGADEVTVDEDHGIQSFSATFRVDKDQPDLSGEFNKPSWWERLKRFINR